MRINLTLLAFLLTVQAVTYGQGSTLDSGEIQGIQKIIKTAATRNPEKIADLISYPLRREYPLKAIATKREFIQRFNEVFDRTLLDSISGSSLDEWAEVGWRGIMFGSGEVWIDDGGKVIAVNYKTEEGKRQLDRAILASKNQLPNSLRDFEKPIGVLFTKHYRIRIDKKRDDSYRYTSWKIRSSSPDPDLVIEKGELEYLGSGGNHSYTFKKNDYAYIISVNVIGSVDDGDATLEVLRHNKQLLRETGTFQ